MEVNVSVFFNPEFVVFYEIVLKFTTHDGYDRPPLEICFIQDVDAMVSGGVSEHKLKY